MNSNNVEQNIAKIQSRYNCRDVQIQQLFHYINLKGTGNIIAYGPRSTCKTCVVKSIVEQFQLFHVWIDVLHHFNNRHIYESILKQIKNHILNMDYKDLDKISELEIETQRVTCSNAIMFIEKLECLLKIFSEIKKTNCNSLEIHKSKLVIILDNIDSIFKEANEEFIYLMNNVEQLVKKVCPISVIYITTHSLDWMSRHSEFKISSLQVVFNNYSNDELLHLLTSRPLSSMEYPIEFYSNYVNIILKSLTPFTRNFSELQSICLKNFDYYVKPIDDDEMTTKDSGKLYLKFQPILQAIIENLSDHRVGRSEINVEMSSSMSYMIIAAYLASFNSSKNDKRFFVRNQGRSRADRRTTSKKENESDKPPKPFTFERVINIYQSLLNLNENNEKTRRLLMITSIIFQQFSELIRQNLIFPLNATNNSISISSIAKYQLSDMVTNKHIQNIAFGIRLNLNAFVEKNF